MAYLGRSISARRRTHRAIHRCRIHAPFSSIQRPAARFSFSSALRKSMGGPPHINQGFGETITRILPTGIDGFGTLWIQSPDCNKAATSTLYGVRIPLSSPAGLRDADISSWVISLTSIKTFAGSERASLSISEFFSGISSFATFHLALPSTPIICNAKEYASWSSSAYTISTEARGPSPRILKKPGPSIERGPTRLEEHQVGVQFRRSSSAHLTLPFVMFRLVERLLILQRGH